MSYRYYGGTFESSPERVLADMEWKKKRYSHKDWKREAEATKRFTWLVNGSTVLLCGLFVFGIIALIVWGIQNLITSGFSWQLLLFNPITWIVCLVGWGAAACR